MTDNKNNNNLTTPATETTPKTTATSVEKETRSMSDGSMQWGVPTREIKRKSILELRREFGDNWV